MVKESKNQKTIPIAIITIGDGEKWSAQQLTSFLEEVHGNTISLPMNITSIYSQKQPDLNWDHPKVRQEMYEIMDYWFQKGVDGFRLDVISVISKRPGLPDTDTTNFNEIIQRYYANGPKIHDYLQEMNERVLSKYDNMTVGEGPGINLTNGIQYVHKDRNELHMVFHLDICLLCASGEIRPHRY